MRRSVTALLIVLALAAAACAPRSAPDGTLPPSTGGASAATWAPTWTPPPSATPGPTATWVPLPSPLPPDEGGALTRAGVPRLDVATARQAVEAGEAILVDVRPRSLYAELHIAGAISMPAEEVADCYPQLPADRTAIFYCA